MENKNIEISKVCGLCAGCKFAIDTCINQLNQNKNVTLFKEVVHNQNVNNMLIKKGIAIENDINNLSQSSTIILRAHGEPKSTIDFLKSNEFDFIDCTCINVKKIHEDVFNHSSYGENIIIIGKYGKKTGIIHPEIAGTIGWCHSTPILIEDEEDVNKLANIKNTKFYLVCQTTFNIEQAENLIEKVTDVCNKNRCELIVNKSICMAQKQINKFSAELANSCDLMIVVGGKNSSNSIELFNNLKKIKPTIFIENILDWESEIKNNNIILSKNTKIGLTAGASTLKSELDTLKDLIEKKFKEI